LSYWLSSPACSQCIPDQRWWKWMLTTVELIGIRFVSCAANTRHPTIKRLERDTGRSPKGSVWAVNEVDC
jgi:hypothetical protein